MSILSINEGFCGDCPVWGFEDGEYFPIEMEMEKKNPPKRDLEIGYVQFPHLYKIVHYEFKKKHISIKKKSLIFSRSIHLVLSMSYLQP
jgi:hypothetical protein